MPQKNEESAKRGLRDIRYTDETKRSPSADAAVRQYAETDKRDLSGGLIKSVPQAAGGHTWHSGGTDPDAEVHITVQFEDSSGKLVTTKHINRNGKGC
ncbi:hypothetical protein GGS24DRAFT_507950 [Hypoxylon argillaceum]|nr:hypothetical protein GGS24DRAFT_507950 [Hypoxylon argillaceum]